MSFVGWFAKFVGVLGLLDGQLIVFTLFPLYLLQLLKKTIRTSLILPWCLDLP